MVEKLPLVNPHIVPADAEMAQHLRLIVQTTRKLWETKEARRLRKFVNHKKTQKRRRRRGWR